MEAVRRVLRVEVAVRWRSWAAIACLVGLAGGAALAAAAGARRTDSAYARLLRSSHAAAMLVSPDGTGFPDYYETLARHTGATLTPVVGFGAAPSRAPTQPVIVTASPDRRFARRVEQPKITAGRLFRPGAGDEVLADIAAAKAFHLHPGSHLRLLVARSGEELPNPARDVTVTVRVVGIGVTRDSVVPVNSNAAVPSLLAGPAFARHLGPDHYAFDGAYVTLPSGVSKSGFAAQAQRLAGRFPNTGGSVFVGDEAQQAMKVEHAIHPEAVALALFAALLALVSLLAIGQLIGRQLVLSAVDHHVLHALGMRRRQLLGVGLAAVTVTAVSGALLATAVAVAASPLMPVGPARLAEPRPGLSVDGPVLAAGFAMIVVLLVAVAVWPAWRSARAGARAGLSEARTRPRRLIGWAGASGAPASALIGIGHAVDPGRGDTAVPVRSAIAVSTLSVAALMAALTFGYNLSRLVHTPRRYGQAWDLTADGQFALLPTSRIDALLSRAPGVTAWTFGVHDLAVIDGHEIPTVGLVRAHGHLLAPTMVAGRAATGARELVLGSTTLDDLHSRVGDDVIAWFAGMFSANGPSPGAIPTRRLRVVGRAVFPVLRRRELHTNRPRCGRPGRRPARSAARRHEDRQFRARPRRSRAPP